MLQESSTTNKKQNMMTEFLEHHTHYDKAHTIIKLL